MEHSEKSCSNSPFLNNSSSNCDKAELNVPNSSSSKENINYVLLSREEIIRKRRERKKAKKQIKKQEKEAKDLEENLYKKSDKLKILKSDEFQKSQTLQERSLKPKRVLTFNFLDYLVKRTKGSKKLKLYNILKKNNRTRLNRGKKRENKQKIVRSRLKKAIIKSRFARKQFNIQNEISSLDKKVSLSDNVESTLDQNHEKILSLEIAVCKFEELSICDVKKRKTIHSRNFRSYCDNLTSPLLRTLTENLIRKIFLFQKRAFQINEIKAQAHRRYVIGFKETKRGLITQKIKLVLIAPDCEECLVPDGIDETIAWIKNKCNEHEVPYLFSLRARQIAYCLYIKVPISCVGIINYDGVQEVYNELIQNLEIERQNYQKVVAESIKDESKVLN